VNLVFLTELGDRKNSWEALADIGYIISPECKESANPIDRTSSERATKSSSSGHNQSVSEPT
jgi:hypothetical protein